MWKFWYFLRTTIINTSQWVNNLFDFIIIWFFLHCYIRNEPVLFYLCKLSLNGSKANIIITKVIIIIKASMSKFTIYTHRAKDGNEKMIPPLRTTSMIPYFFRGLCVFSLPLLLVHSAMINFPNKISDWWFIQKHAAIQTGKHFLLLIY